MDRLKDFLSKHAKAVLAGGLIVLVGASIFGFGLFNVLSESSDNFYANGTESERVNQKVNDIFGTSEAKSSIVLFEAKDRKADVRTEAYETEVKRLLASLDTRIVTSYYSTRSTQFISRDKQDTYAVVTVNGSDDEQYRKLTDFAESAKNSTFNVSVGGTFIGQRQTQAQTKADLRIAEMVSLPILAILLFWFFRSVVATAIPLVMSLLTIAGALAVTRIIHLFAPIDTYTINVITILSVGLSIDYSLLAVNRFREELREGHSNIEAAKNTIKTAGRTIFFSGVTVIVCLLSLLLFPVGFMQSVSIGGAAAVLVAVIISVLLLPPALQLIGSNLDKWSLRSRNNVAKGWRRLAHLVTRRPYIALFTGVVAIGLLVWPVTLFQTKAFDWRVLPNNKSAHHVGKVLDEQFDIEVASLTVLAQFETAPTPEQLCSLAKTVQNVEGVVAVQAAYASTAIPDCRTLQYTLQQLQMNAPDQAKLLALTAQEYVRGNYARIEVVPSYDVNDTRIKNVMRELASTSYASGATVSITGQAARAQDTLDAYRKWLPYVAAMIAIAMVVILSVLLGSVILPIQAVIINSLALFISLGVLVMIFQFGWGADLLSMTVTGGFELSIPILIFVIAFGLSMDYAVFLYSRMHEIYDKTGSYQRAIVEGMTKTGPIITAAALLLFVVVSAFAASRIAIIQQIGVGLAVAVLVDAFFVRTILVPVIMKLFGRSSWWAPAWLKKMTIKHE